MAGRRRLSSIALAFTALVVAGSAARAAWDFSATVVDPAGLPIADAVVVLTPANPLPLPPLAPDTRAAEAQKDKAFVPRVLAIRTGTLVSFPNRDPIMHHVYSFSPTKTFELELYGEKEIPELSFDKAGVVPLACNIHDSMRGHIYVTDSPWFAVSAADGMVSIGQLPDATFKVAVWHERQTGDADASITAKPGAAPLRLVVALRPRPLFELAPNEAGEY